MTIKCAKCKQKLFKYMKIGKGKLLHLWPERIKEDYSVREGNQVKCTCGNLIGIDEGKRIKLRRRAFIRSGTVSKG